MSIRPAILLFVSLALCGCSGQYSISLKPTIEEADSKLQLVRADDPNAVSQLAAGIGSLENTYRWTARAFTILLGVPHRATRNGANLSLHFYLPDSAIKQLGTISVQSRIGNRVFSKQSYASPGSHIYKSEIPQSCLKSSCVAVQFQVDKCIRPTARDQRELGLVFNSAELESQ